MLTLAGVGVNAVTVPRRRKTRETVVMEDSQWKYAHASPSDRPNSQLRDKSIWRPLSIRHEGDEGLALINVWRLGGGLMVDNLNCLENTLRYAGRLQIHAHQLGAPEGS